jgi:hypothetical protein
MLVLTHIFFGLALDFLIWEEECSWGVAEARPVGSSPVGL